MGYVLTCEAVIKFHNAYVRLDHVQIFFDIIPMGAEFTC